MLTQMEDPPRTKLDKTIIKIQYRRLILRNKANRYDEKHSFQTWVINYLAKIVLF